MGQYRIVDLDEFGYSRMKATEAAAKTGAVHEGALFGRATHGTVIHARYAWKAMDMFASRVWCSRSFPHDRFIALSQGLWEKICALQSLPRDCTHSDLRAAALAARPLQPAASPRRREPAVDPKRPEQLLLFV